MRATTLILLAVAITALASCVSLPFQQADSNWDTYLGDNGRQHFSPLSQITPDNVTTLTTAWVYDSGEPDGTMYTSPVVVDGVLYGLSPSLVPFALNAATGEPIWRNDLDLPGNAQRGLMWWQKDGVKRIFFTAGRELIALDANTGEPVAGFGAAGRVDLTPPPGDRGYIAVTVPGVVFEDRIILGFSTNESADGYPGSVRAFSAVDGSLEWTFHLIPKPGEVGSETWDPDDLADAGGANVWTGMTLDDERGLLFAPTGSPTPDFYGGNRHGDNLFGNSLVAIDARTGTYRWHFQVVRHDLWDKDNPSPPTLVTMERDGRSIDAVALTTKTGHLYAFDRDTGEPLYDVLEVDTLPSTIPGEAAAPRQPVSAVEISRQQFEVTNRTPEARAFVENQIKDWDLRPWAPPYLGTVLFYPWYDGGAEWGGSAFDRDRGRLILNTNDAAAVLTLGEVPVGHSRYGIYMTHCGACHGSRREGTDAGPALDKLMDRLGFDEVRRIVAEGQGRMPGFAHLDERESRAIYEYILPEEIPDPDPPTDEVGYALTSGYVYLKDHEGLPGNAPPWGNLSAIDLATGEPAWRVPFGNFPSHPDLGYGAINYGGPVVTASGLVFIAATPDRMFRAYAAEDGELLWQTELDAAGFSTPAVYSVDGRQFVVIAAGGGRLGPPSGSKYYAFALPEAHGSR